jgi:hypothetical protein
MAQLKTTASLSSGLLARKGQARPAMRPQGLTGFGNMTDALEDLGWNDMGQADEHPAQPDLKPALTPMHTATPMPTVLRQREALREEIEAPAEAESMPADEPVAEAPEPTAEAPQPVAEASRPVVAPATTPRASVSVATAARIGRETSGKGKGRGRGNRNAAGKAAFTLRLDTDRHLRLRLASALCNRSAQVLVTEALDALLESLPEIDELVRQLPKRN